MMIKRLTKYIFRTSYNEWRSNCMSRGSSAMHQKFWQYITTELLSVSQFASNSNHEMHLSHSLPLNVLISTDK